MLVNDNIVLFYGSVSGMSRVLVNDNIVLFYDSFAGTPVVLINHNIVLFYDSTSEMSRVFIACKSCYDTLRIWPQTVPFCQWLS